MFRLAARTATRSVRLYSTAPAKRSPLKFATFAMVGGLLVGGALAMGADAAEPKLLDAKAAETGEVQLLTEEDFEPEPQGAYNPETGEINWDCPCLGGMAHGPCGEEFKKAFSCFVYSTAEPKGMECIEAFQGMQDCFRQHPDVYAEQLADESEPSVVENVDKAGLALEEKAAEVSEKVATKVTEVKDQIQTKIEDVGAKIEAQPITKKVKEATAQAVSKITPDAKSETWSAESDTQEFKEKLHNSTKKSEGKLENIAHGLADETEKLKEKFSHRTHEAEHQFSGEGHSETDEAARQTGSFREKLGHRLDETADQLRHLGGK